MPGADETPHRLRRPVTDADRARGPADAPVTLLEYGDYECPHCRRFHPVVERLIEAEGRRLRFVFRFFPLESEHPRAMAAALAAEAAGRQGKFWEMHATLFERAQAPSDQDLLGYARELGLDAARFQADLADPELARAIQQSRLDGLRSGVNGTPTLFINGVRYDGPRDRKTLSRIIERAAQS